MDNHSIHLLIHRIHRILALSLCYVMSTTCQTCRCQASTIFKLWPKKLQCAAHVPPWLCWLTFFSATGCCLVDAVIHQVLCPQNHSTLILAMVNLQEKGNGTQNQRGVNNLLGLDPVVVIVRGAAKGIKAFHLKLAYLSFFPFVKILPVSNDSVIRYHFCFAWIPNPHSFHSFSVNPYDIPNLLCFWGEVSEAMVLWFFLFCFVYLCLFIIFRSESWCCRFDSLLFDSYRCHTIDS